ncbi:MAG: RNA-protein complex protein Nop10 [Thermoplasmatales archaeon]|nr:RNA-protein complex protein Nop10 [Thermoplasmatales archaeon]MCW6170537.1 RNA-protein complex protein Nop10 [Thermoplasmatales archaeon]
MKSLIRKCSKCGVYTLELVCPKCGGPTEVALPERYSPIDRFGKYRLKMMEGNSNGKDNN